MGPRILLIEKVAEAEARPVAELPGPPGGLPVTPHTGENLMTALFDFFEFRIGLAKEQAPSTRTIAPRMLEPVAQQGFGLATTTGFLFKPLRTGRLRPDN